MDERTHDSSAVIALNLLKSCGVRDVLLAGMDGFSVDINDNYFDPEMRRPVNGEQVARRNRYYRVFIENKRKEGINITFITRSMYECK